MHTLAASAGVTDTAQKFCKRTAHHVLVLLQLLRYVNQCASSALQRLHYSFLCALPGLKLCHQGYQKSKRDGARTK